MNVQPLIKLNSIETSTADAYLAGRHLGELLSETPEFLAFLDALKAVNQDLTVQKKSAQMRKCQNEMQWGRDVLENSTRFDELEQELEEMSVVKAYRQAEIAFRQLILAVEEIISREAGVDFVSNAKRSCCG